MKKNVKIVLAVVIVAIIIAVIAIAIGVKSNIMDEDSASTKPEELAQETAEEVLLEDVYSCDLTVYGSDNTIMYIYFNNNANVWVIELGNEPAAKGTFETKGNEIITTAKNPNGEESAEIRYLLDGAYLLLEDGMYQGLIPEGEAFDAEVSKKDSTGMEIRYTFKGDGTYTCLEIPEGKKESEGIQMEGTYKREGNLITRTLSGNEMIPFYVYEDHLFASYYVADESEAAQNAAGVAEFILEEENQEE